MIYHHLDVFDNSNWRSLAATPMRLQLDLEGSDALRPESQVPYAYRRLDRRINVRRIPHSTTKVRRTLVLQGGL